jgi:aminoglycoside phosphotransferase (APT) family kinase protein
MSFIEGACVEPGHLPEGKELPAGEVRSRMLDAARILGTLHSLDPATLGLTEGEDRVTPTQELDRWVPSVAACDEDLRMGEDVLLAAYLEAGGVRADDLDWFEALVRDKQLAITALLARNARRRGEDPGYARSLQTMAASARLLLGLPDVA